MIDETLALLWSIIDVGERNLGNLGFADNLPLILGKVFTLLITLVFKLLLRDFGISTFRRIGWYPILRGLVAERKSQLYPDWE